MFQAVENLYLFRAVLVFYFFRHCRLFLLVIVFSLMFCFVTISPACALVCVCARRILYADKLIIAYPPEKVQRFSAINPICGKIFLLTKKSIARRFTAHNFCMKYQRDGASLCPSCNGKMQILKSYYCPDCGDRVCEACAKKNGGLCRRCYSPLCRLS